MSAHRKSYLLRAFWIFVIVYVVAYLIWPWACRKSADITEANAVLAGDEVVASLDRGYTLGTTIKAEPAKIWPWLVQMGQGRGGFYTYEWIENTLGADIHNAAQINPLWQSLKIGDSLRLTPDPYFGNRGRYLVTARLDKEEALIFRQTLLNGSTGSWAYILEPASDNTTRLLFRRRTSGSSLFDRILEPGYYLMDLGMLRGIKERAER